ncbi:MAG: hypothetical protein QOF78_978, partial [Phycisphaerales bacterium]|nr:hypothetical protein [Phycisphaerales bacterium]
MIAAALLAIVLTLPSLYVGLSSDDYYQRWLLTGSEGYAEVRPPRMQMFTFLDGNPARAQRMKQLGLLPWWVYDNVRASFWRPITTLTHIADYQLWPRRPEGMHAQSIAWYAALVLLVAMLYRKMMGRTVAAALAVIMFAVDDAHVIPVGFIASRNALIAAVFGVLAIICHRRWRLEAERRGRRQIAFAVLAIACFIASLLSAEAGLATFGYLLAYEIALERGRWTRRLAALAPYVIAIIAWRAIWKSLGYGVAALDGLYTDPLAQPLTFIGDVMIRLPLLLLGQAAYPPADVGLVVNGAGRIGFALIGIVVVSLSVWMLWRLLRHNRVARFWVLGLVFAAIPCCAPAPSNRMLLFISIGAFGVTGQFISMALHARYWSGLSRWRRLGRFSFVAATVVMHLVFAPITLFMWSHWPLGWPDMWDAIHEIPDITAADVNRDVVIVNHPLAVNM